MALLRIQHQFNHASGLAADVVVNTFYVLGPDPTAPGVLDAAPGLVTAVGRFYNAGVGQGDAAVVDFMHTKSFAELAHTVKIYNMADPTPRAPITTETFGGPVGSVNTADGLPHEVAICLSYNALPISGTSQKRRRGRIYIGPLASNAATDILPTNVVRPEEALRQVLLDSGERLSQEFDAVGYDWVIFSPTTHGSDAPVLTDAAISQVQQLSVDDAFDTQRRRGEARTLVQSITL